MFPFKCTVQPCTLLGQCCFACCAVVAYVISACSIKHNSANAPYLPWWAAHCNADADQHRVVFPCKCTVQPCTLLGQCCFACCAVVAYVISACSIKHNSANAPYLPWWAAHCNADADQHRVVFPCKCTVQPCTLLDQCCFACCSVVAYVISACSIKHNSANAPYLPLWAAY